MPRHVIAAASLGLALVASAACRSAAERYPSGPVLLVCPWAVGGGTDRLSRQVATFLEADLGVPVNVINAPGGGGVTGHGRGARGRPDGSVITMMTIEITTLHWRELTSISWRDFEPVMLLNRDPAAIFVRADDGRFATLQDVLSAARARPGALTASGTASGGIWHLALAGALDTAGLDPSSLRWIPMDGAAPALQELMGGGLDVVTCSLPEARSLLSTGRIRSLGVMAEARVASFEAIPTLREQGIDWVMGTWRGLGCPAGTPPAVRDRLVAAMKRIVAGETEVNGQRLPQMMDREGLILHPEEPAEFAATLAGTDEALGALLQNPAFASVRESRFDAMDFPRLLLGALALSATAIIVSRVRRRADTADTAARAVGASALLRLGEVIAAVVLYTLVAERLGFVLTMAALLFALLWRFGTSVLVSVLVAGLVVPVVYSVFATLLRVPLPVGWLGW